jgi:hypothetical protein
VVPDAKSGASPSAEARAEIVSADKLRKAQTSNKKLMLELEALKASAASAETAITPKEPKHPKPYRGRAPDAKKKELAKMAVAHAATSARKKRPPVK